MQNYICYEIIFSTTDLYPQQMNIKVVKDTK
jgi:hypothetical protein